jgi:hypothetical protein
LKEIWAICIRLQIAKNIRELAFYIAALLEEGIVRRSLT